MLDSTNNDQQRKRIARSTGAIYLAWILVGFYDMLFVSPQIFDRGSPPATAQNLLAHEFLFRTSIFSGLVTNAIWILLAWYFYRLLMPVNKGMAKLLVAFVIVQVPIALTKTAFSMAALMTLKGEILTAFDASQQQSLALFFLKINDFGVWGLEFFWGLWLFPLAFLVYYSTFLPRFIGVWLAINGIVYVVLSFASLVKPEYKSAVFTYGMPGMFGELVLVLWLLVKGTMKPNVIPNEAKRDV